MSKNVDINRFNTIAGYFAGLQAVFGTATLDAYGAPWLNARFKVNGAIQGAGIFLGRGNWFHC